MAILTGDKVDSKAKIIVKDKEDFHCDSRVNIPER